MLFGNERVDRRIDGTADGGGIALCRQPDLPLRHREDSGNCRSASALSCRSSPTRCSPAINGTTRAGSKLLQALM